VPRRRPAGSIAGLALLCLAAAGCGAAPHGRPTSIASGAVGGIYQPIAAAIARIARETPGLDLPLTVEATGASVANVQLLGDGRVQLALAQNDIAYYAFQGTALQALRGRARSDLRAILSIYPEYVHVVAAARPAAAIASVADFRGKRVALGPEGSGTEQNALQVLEAHGLKPADLARGERIDTAEAVTRMRAGQLDGAFFTVGAGSGLIRELLAEGHGRLVPVPRAEITRLRAKVPFYWLDEIPAGTYPSQADAVSSPSLRVLLLTTAETEEAAVYGLTKALIDNLPTLQAAHPAARTLSTDSVLRVVTVPVHPGALRLYRERNIQQ
jgi:TRAP transporter TAXI family solute receptor